MKKRNKNILIISAIIISISVIAIGVTYFYTQNEKKKIEEDAIEKRKQELIEEYEAKDQYIGINGCFLGTVNNQGEWKSANEYITDTDDNYSFKLGDSVKVNVNKAEYTSDDIIKNDGFYLYDEYKFYRKNNDVFFDKDLNPEYYTDINYFRFNSDKYYNNSNEEESYEKDYNNFLDFQLSKSLDMTYPERVIFVQEENYIEYEKYVKQVLDDKKLEIDIVIDKVLIIDSDKNGEEEIYILSNSKHEAVDDKFENGRYSLVLKVENENVEVILERVLIPDEMSDMEYISKYFDIYGLTLIDFNNDGKLEIVIYSCIWDIPEIYVIRLNEANEKELCLYGCFAW